MNNISVALSVAESIADRYGDLQAFKMDYSCYRDNSGILDSMVKALDNQGLWPIFLSSADTKFLEKYFSKI